MDQATKKPDTVQDALDNVRAATQELHRAISAAVAKGASATKAEVESLAQKAKQTADSARMAMQSRQQTAQTTARQKLAHALAKLETAEKHATESLKKSGDAFHASLAKSLTDARASLQDISEAIAMQRSEQAKKAGVKVAS